MRVELTNGNWAELRDFEERPLNNRERTRVLRVWEHGIVKSTADTWRLVNALLQEGVEKWSFELPLPKDQMRVDPLEGPLGDLSLEDSNTLGMGVLDFAMKLFPDFSPSPAPDSPTPPSGD